MEKLKIAMAFMALIATAGCNDEPSNPVPQVKDGGPAHAAGSNAPAPPPPSPAEPSPNTATSGLATDVSNANVPSHANLPVWTPEKEMLDKFDDYIDFEGYQIRLPKGYKAIEPSQVPPFSKAYVWAGESREDGTRPMIMIMLITPPPDSVKHTSQEVLERIVGKIKQYRNNWQQRAIEEGQVNNLKFLKTSWQGQDKQTQVNMQGFEYVTQDDSSFVHIRTQDMEQYPDSLKIGNASILTFRKNK